MKRKAHVLSESWPDRLICGRRRVRRIRLVELEKAQTEPELCGKCRQQVRTEQSKRSIRRDYRPPAGTQFTFEFMEDVWRT